MLIFFWLGGQLFEFVESFFFVSAASVRIHGSLGLDFYVFCQCSSFPGAVTNVSFWYFVYLGFGSYCCKFLYFVYLGFGSYCFQFS